MKKKLLSMLLACALAVTPFTLAACNPKVPDTEETLEIFVLDAGFGTQWTKDIAAMFKEEDWVKEKYPNLIVDIKTSALTDQAKNYMNNGAKINTIDLLFDTPESLGYSGPQGDMLDLYDIVYNTEVPGETRKVMEKMSASAVDAMKYRGADAPEKDAYYNFPWQFTMDGIIYNERLLTEANIEVPRTTDELIAAVEHFADPTAKNGPIATWGISTYWTYVFDAWWGQYAGRDGYEQFYEGIADNTDNNVDIFKQGGRLQAMEVVYDLLAKKENVWMCETTDRSNFIETQTRLLQGTSVFMANGTWFDNEMRGVIKNLKAANGRCDTVRMMMTPVISAITDKLEFSDMTDAQLSAVVKAIDEGKTYAQIKDTYPSAFTENDFNVILDARTTYYGGCGGNAYIPKYAKGKEVAADFLRYMATDKALNQYIASTEGCALSFFDYDVKTADPELYATCSDFSKDILDRFSGYPYREKLTPLPFASMYPLVAKGGISSCRTVSVRTIGQACTERDRSDTPLYGSAKEIYDANIAYWTDNNNYSWNQALDKAGLK